MDASAANQSPTVYTVTVVTWLFTSIALLLTIGRYVIRFNTRRRFFWDDGWHLLATLFLISNSGVYQVFLPLAIQTQLALAQASLGGPPPDPAAFEAMLLKYARMNIVAAVNFYVVLYFVKFAFLAFYKLLFGVSQTFMKLWWAVLVFTLLSFGVTLGGLFTICGGNAGHLGVPQYCSTASALANFDKLVIYLAAFTVASDIAIMALPLFMLKGLQINTQKKIGLVAIFSLASIVIIVDIIRTDHFFHAIQDAQDTDPAIWTCFEANIAVIISALPTYRSLFSKERKRTVPQYVDLEYRSKQSKSTGDRSYLTGTTHSLDQESANEESNVGGLTHPEAVHDARQIKKTTEFGYKY